MFIWCKFDSTLGQQYFIPINLLLSSVAGGAVSHINPDSTGLNPSWRKALSQVYIYTTWSEGSPAHVVSQQIDKMKQSTLILDRLTTDSGSYLNEVKKRLMFE